MNVLAKPVGCEPRTGGAGFYLRPVAVPTGLFFFPSSSARDFDLISLQTSSRKPATVATAAAANTISSNIGFAPFSGAPPASDSASTR